VQIGSDGKRSEGKLYSQRAGRVRFEYAQPATLELVADGARVMVRDLKLNTRIFMRSIRRRSNFC